MNRKIALLAAALFLKICIDAGADTVVLKNGKKILGEVVRETDEAVTISKSGGDFIYCISRERVELIRESTPEELALQGTQNRDPGPVRAAEQAGRPEKEQLRKNALLEKYEREVEAAKKARGRIKIEFIKGRPGLVEATINGRVKAALLVDTGASIVLISRQIADRAGIADSERKGRVHITLADGSVTTATAVTLDSVEVGSSKVKDVSAAISDSPPGQNMDGLLGMTFLKHFHVKMDRDKKHLLLEKY